MSGFMDSPSLATNSKPPSPYSAKQGGRVRKAVNTTEAKLFKQYPVLGRFSSA